MHGLPVVALAEPSVPAGRYAAEAFARAGLPVPAASQEPDVKAVLTKVDSLKASELEERISMTEAALAKRAAAHPRALATSSRSDYGIGELRAAIAELLSERMREVR